MHVTELACLRWRYLDPDQNLNVQMQKNRKGFRELFPFGN
jgi:hypothetical protein